MYSKMVMAGKHMLSDRAGTCVYCGKMAVDNCQFCGALVCKEHLHKSTGSCVKCLGGKKVECGC